MPVIPIHYANIYQRPAQGSAFVRRYPIYNYQHTITNQGWFDTASCDIAIRTQSEGQKILNQYLGSYIAFFVDNPAVPIWEGLINRITFNSGKMSYSASLDDMANRVSVVYTGATNVVAQSALANNTASQALYGVKQDQIEMGTDVSGTATQRPNLRDTIIAQRAFPQTAESQAQGQTNLVHLELIGMFHTLEWEKFFTALSAGATAFNTSVIAILAGLANGTTFFNSADTTQISTNATTEPNQQRGTSAWDRLLKMAEAGDGSNYWVAGILPTNKNSGNRVFYYRQANFNTLYNTRQADAMNIRDLYGRIVKTWNVRPDCVIRVTDALINTISSNVLDPSLTYIQSIQYDANSQQVQWFGADNTTARAAFQLNKGFKALSKNMPNTAPLRTIVT